MQFYILGAAEFQFYLSSVMRKESWDNESEVNIDKEWI
jgi:hypothetical protein